MVRQSKQIGELLADDSFIRWIEGASSPGEAAGWQSWSEAGSDRVKLIEEARRLHHQLRFEIRKRDDIEQELIKLNTALDARGANTVKAVGSIHSMNRKRRSSAVWAVAAVFLVLSGSPKTGPVKSRMFGLI